jgi:hypothetical protein
MCTSGRSARNKTVRLKLEVPTTAPCGRPSKFSNRGEPRHRVGLRGSPDMKVSKSKLESNEGRCVWLDLPRNKGFQGNSQ